MDACLCVGMLLWGILHLPCRSIAVLDAAKRAAVPVTPARRLPYPPAAPTAPCALPRAHCRRLADKSPRDIDLEATDVEVLVAAPPNKLQQKLRQIAENNQVGALGQALVLHEYAVGLAHDRLAGSLPQVSSGSWPPFVLCYVLRAALSPTRLPCCLPPAGVAG